MAPKGKKVAPAPLATKSAKSSESKTHYSNPLQRISVLVNQFNQKEIYPDLLNGQNTLDYKDKRKFYL